MSYKNLEEYLVPRSYFDQGGLWSWGFNNLGQLGDNTSVRKSSPVQTVSGGTNWKQVTSGLNHTAGIKTDGTLWTVGYNLYGELGISAVTNRSSPVQTVSGGTNWKQVSGGEDLTAAIKTNGTLWTWGHNLFGQLGDNTQAHKSSPVQTVSGGGNWKQVSSGIISQAAIKTDGTLWTWGNNVRGQLGNNNTTNRSSPVQTVSGGTNWKQVSCGYYLTSAIKTDGTLWLWGDNGYGSLGDNTVVAKSSPVQTVSGGTNWKSVSLGYHYASAIKTDGTLWSWGRNNLGQLGDNTTTNNSSPIQTVSGGTNWKLLGCGYYHASAIKTDGTLWLWGQNNTGQLGDNTVVAKSSPVQTVSGGTNWKQVDGGHSHTAGLNSTWGTIT